MKGNRMIQRKYEGKSCIKTALVSTAQLQVRPHHLLWVGSQGAPSSLQRPGPWPGCTSPPAGVPALHVIPSGAMSFLVTCTCPILGSGPWPLKETKGTFFVSYVLFCTLLPSATLTEQGHSEFSRCDSDHVVSDLGSLPPAYFPICLVSAQTLYYCTLMFKIPNNTPSSCRHFRLSSQCHISDFPGLVSHFQKILCLRTDGDSFPPTDSIPVLRHQQ